jgi:hypothetical protein
MNICRVTDITRSVNSIEERLAPLSVSAALWIDSR